MKNSVSGMHFYTVVFGIFVVGILERGINNRACYKWEGQVRKEVGRET
jgi:hypothetical protein